MAGPELGLVFRGEARRACGQALSPIVTLKPFRESNKEFSGTDRLRTYVRVVPRPSGGTASTAPAVPPVAGAVRLTARAQSSRTPSTYGEIQMLGARQAVATPPRPPLHYDDTPSYNDPFKFSGGLTL